VRPRRLAAAAACALALACGPAPGAGPRRISIATGGTGGVYYPLGGALARLVSESVPGVEATAEVTSASVDNLKLIRTRQADVAFTLADSLLDAHLGRGAFAESPVPVAALAVLYTNYTHLVARAGAGVVRVADLRGKVVSTGSAGSGTEVIALRMLEAAGLDPRSDVKAQSLGAGPSADALRDGKLDAFFWSGGVPTAAVLDLFHALTGELRLVPNGELVDALNGKHGGALYRRVVVGKGVYPGVAEDTAVVGVSNVLVVHPAMTDDLAYRITRLLFDRRADLEAVHGEARHLTLETAVAGSPVTFHPGARRFYAERGVLGG
jgi:TRAP transporter TAXI family solute receptor